MGYTLVSICTCGDGNCNGDLFTSRTVDSTTVGDIGRLRGVGLVGVSNVGFLTMGLSIPSFLLSYEILSNSYVICFINSRTSLLTFGSLVNSVRRVLL